MIPLFQYKNSPLTVWPYTMICISNDMFRNQNEIRLPILTAIQTTAVYSVTRLVDTEFTAWMLTIFSIGRHAF